MTTKQLASLEAVAKKAAARASQAMSKLIGVPVTLEVTRARMVEVERLVELIASPEERVAAVMLPVTGEGLGSSALVSSIEESFHLAELLLKQPRGSITEHSGKVTSALQETANIIGGAFLSELSNTTNISLVQSVPSFLADTIKGVVDAAMVKLHHDDGKLSVAFEVDFGLSVSTTTTTTTETIVAHYLFLLQVAFAQKLLAALEKTTV